MFINVSIIIESYISFVFANENLTAFESLVLYLKNEMKYTYHEIAVMLKRDDRTIWGTYQRASKKNVR